MKHIKQYSFPLIVILVAWLPWLMAAFDKDKPSASTSLRSSNPEILANWSQIQTALNLDHEFAGTSAGTQTGKHEVLTMQEEASAGASSTNEGHFQIIDGGSQPELAFTSEDGDELQFTKDGDLYSSDNLVVDGTSTLTGAVGIAADISIGAGADLLLSTTSDITISGNTFTVAGATGNTVVAGTLTVTGVATLGDASLLATSAAPTTDAMIANMKYVDDNVGSANYTPTSYAGGESVTFPNGLIYKMGTTGSISGDTTVEITYGTAFPNGIVSMQVSWKDKDVNQTETIQIQQKSGSLLTVAELTNTSGTAAPAWWFVIGH